MNLLAINIGDEFLLKEGPTPVPISSIPAYETLGSFISAVLPNIYVLATLILLFLLIFGGLTFIVSAGRGNQEDTKKSQQTITAVLIGFLLVFASWWIIEIIKTVTGIDILGGGGL